MYFSYEMQKKRKSEQNKLILQTEIKKENTLKSTLVKNIVI
jgi:hypothetical protein